MVVFLVVRWDLPNLIKYQLHFKLQVLSPEIVAIPSHRLSLIFAGRCR